MERKYHPLSLAGLGKANDRPALIDYIVNGAILLGIIGFVYWIWTVI